MKVKLDALDTLFFGLGKPAIWGEDTFGVGMFPPYPSVIRGAVRAAWLYENSSFDEADTERDLSRAFQVSEYALFMDGAPHFPVPADHVQNRDGTLIHCTLKDNDRLSSLFKSESASTSKDANQFGFNTPAMLWADAKDKVVSPEKMYIPLSDFENYLKGCSIGSEPIPLKERLTAESRIGIYKERSVGTVKKGMLYHTPLVRPQNAAGDKLSVVANIVGNEMSESIVRLGSQGKMAKISEFSENISPCGYLGDDGRFILYLATPAIFDKGWEPKLHVEAELLTAAVYGYENVGGFDMKAKQPKQMYRAVKQGSVYYYKLKENTDINRAEVMKMHGTSISKEYSKDGFGIVYVGRIREENACTKM